MVKIIGYAKFKLFCLINSSILATISYSYLPGLDFFIANWCIMFVILSADLISSISSVDFIDLCFIIALIKETDDFFSTSFKEIFNSSLI